MTARRFSSARRLRPILGRAPGWALALSAGFALAAAAQPGVPGPARPGQASLPAPQAVPAPGPVAVPASSPPVAAGPPAEVAATPAPPTPKPKPLPPLPGSAAVRAANLQARSFPTSDAYINATLYYDYEAGRLYQVQTSPHFLTALLLRPGEKLVAKAMGDTVRWVLGETSEGSGADQRVVVLLKPIRGGLRTNVVLTTDQRTYLVEAASRDGGTYTSAVSWNYPQEQMAALAAAQAAKAASAAAEAKVVVAAPASPVELLHFGYRIEPLKGKPPRWQPLRVFDDGAKTYIQFPINMAATEAPPLFLVGPHDAAELVNYRYLNGYYIVDRLIDVAELRIGEKPQTIVRITRTGERG